MSRMGHRDELCESPPSRDILDSLSQEEYHSARSPRSRPAPRGLPSNRGSPLPLRPDSPGNRPFKDCPDIARQNQSCHMHYRKDTFHTPAGLEKNGQAGGGKDNSKRWGLGDSRDLLQICELAFARSLRSLGEDIMVNLREEIEANVSRLREELRLDMKEIGEGLGMDFGAREGESPAKETHAHHDSGVHERSSVVTPRNEGTLIAHVSDVPAVPHSSHEKKKSIVVTSHGAHHTKHESSRQSGGAASADELDSEGLDEDWRREHEHDPRSSRVSHMRGSELHRASFKEGKGLYNLVGHLVERVTYIEEIVSQPAELSTADVVSLKEEVSKASETGQAAAEVMRRLENSFAERLLQIHEEVLAIRKTQKEQPEDVLVPAICRALADVKCLPEMEHVLVDSSDRLNQLVSMQEHLVADVSQTSFEIQRLQQASLKHHADLVPCLDTQFSKFFREQALNVDLGAVMGVIDSTHRAHISETITIRAEIARIQQALNVDFANVLEGIGQVRQETLTQKALEDDAAKPPKDVVEVKPKKKRLRDYFTQTMFVEKKDQQIQTVKVKDDGSVRKKKKTPQVAGTVQKQRSAVPVFADKDKLKKRIREAMIKEQYNVFDYYHDEGIVKEIATHPVFEHMTFAFIFTNAVWIGIDADNNPAELLVDADPVFQVIENVFCLFFTSELAIRFLAFKSKRDAFRDMWFNFDAVLVFLMIMETWILTIIFVAIGSDTGGKGLGATSILRITRIVKVLRMARMARLLRTIPELVILMKGLFSALRSVAVFGLLWAVIIYIFALFLVQTTRDTPLRDLYFGSVPDAMNTLLLDGVLPDFADLVNTVTGESPSLFPFMMGFILISSVTLMYMLVGVLVEVVGAIASSEKEKMAVMNIAQDLRMAMQESGMDTGSPMSKLQFTELIYSGAMVDTLQDAEIDPMVLIDMTDVIFESVDRDGQGMTFEKFVDTVLNLRGGNVATVKDVKQQLLVFKSILNTNVEGLLKKLREEFAQMRLAMADITIEREDNDVDDEDDEEVRQTDRRGSAGDGDLVEPFSAPWG
eukprot:TRINITY_DN2695_c0_g2_i1.p1 TRINITY_DN2695_c0_g2~~TRINITY_DN2695_c0_g2_i1.p1  ORF type:complete len:1045 (-),score=308.42 TRINITY_DN2695_c0_g2_i1:150-3284(-)